MYYGGQLCKWTFCTYGSVTTCLILCWFFLPLKFHLIKFAGNSSENIGVCFLQGFGVYLWQHFTAPVFI